MTSPRGARSSAIGTLIALAAVVVLSWMAIRKMTDTQRAHLDAGSAPVAGGPATSGAQMLPTIPEAIVADAGKTPIARVDVVLRVDGLDVSIDGAPACRDGHKRLVGRAAGGGPGSFDEGALTSCLAKARVERPTARFVALVTRAGPAVPTTYADALAAALRRAGCADVVTSM